MKKHNRDVSTAPSWVVRLDDDEDEEDPEFYGAPAFESRLAPEGYKETTRHNPRAIHKNFRNFRCSIRNSECFPQIYSVSVATERGKQII
nr:hypothetical protein CFP56_06937 [Quercus suber]